MDKSTFLSSGRERAHRALTGLEVGVRPLVAQEKSLMALADAILEQVADAVFPAPAENLDAGIEQVDPHVEQAAVDPPVVS